MADWAPEIGAITLFEDDLTEAKAFYQTVFGTPPHFEDDTSVVFRFGRTLLNLLQTAAAHDLVAPASVGDRAAASDQDFTIRVDDVDAVCEDLRDRGVALLSEPADHPSGVRTAAFQDPSGHTWKISQDLPSKFMLFIRVQEGLHLSAEERVAMSQSLDAWRADLNARSARVMASELLGGPSVREVRVRDGRPEVHNGASAREAEPVTGFVIVECQNLDEAVAIALRHPVARFGAIEVRPFAP